MNSAIIKNQPFLSHPFFTIFLLFSHFIHLLSQPYEQLPYKVKILVFTISTFNDTPMGQPILCYNSNYRESFPFRNRAIYSDLLVRSSPGFITSHVKIEPAFVQKIYPSLLLPNLVVLWAIVKSFLERFGSISFFWNTFDSFLFKLADL